MIEQVEQANSKQKHGETLKLINKISGRKTAKKGSIKGDTREDPILVDHLIENIDNILIQTEISDDIFTQDEIKQAKIT